MYEIIQNEVGTFVKVRSEFPSKEKKGETVKLTRYFKFDSNINLNKFHTRASLQSSDFLRKNIEENLVPKGICEPINPAELIDEMLD